MTVSGKLSPSTVLSRPGRETAPGATRPRRRKNYLRLGQLGAVAVVLLVWTLVYLSGTFSRELVPSVGDVAVALVRLAGRAVFWQALGGTVLNAMVALALGIVVGVPLGLVMGISPALQRSTRFLVDVGRAFPVIALLPVMVLVFGATSRMEIVVVFAGVVWPVMLQTIDGARRVEPVIADTVRAYRIPLRLRFFKVVLPNAAPFAVTGIRIAASASILIALGVEVLSLTPGMGGNLSRAQTQGAPALALAYVIYAGLVGLLVNKVLWTAESKFLAWNRRAVAVAR